MLQFPLKISRDIRELRSVVARNKAPEHNKEIELIIIYYVN